jgi:hypothetical protein
MPFSLALDFFYVVSFVASFESLVLIFCLAKWKVDVVGKQGWQSVYDQFNFRRRATVANLLLN